MSRQAVAAGTNTMPRRTPHFPMIPIAKPYLDENEAEAARRVILSGWLTQGPEVAAFEQEFAAAVNASHACAVSNCTTALHLALRAAGVGPGDEVITVSHSYIATANSIRYCGAVPVFIDIGRDSFNLDPRLVDSAVTAKTRAILCVHQVGLPCDLSQLVQLAQRHHLPLIEDAACAVGSEILWNEHWERIGRPHGDVACFSFHPRKVLSTGDGGMITTRHPDWDAKFRRWRQHSMSVSDASRHGASRVIFESYPELGYNYRMTDVQAAIGREQLKRLDAFITRRRQLARGYHHLLGGVEGLTTPSEPDWARANWQSYAVRLGPGIQQVAVMQALLDQGIATRRGIMCAHREPAYQNGSWKAGSTLHESESAQDECILLPLFHVLTEEEQQSVASKLIQATAPALAG